LIERLIARIFTPSSLHAIASSRHRADRTSGARRTSEEHFDLTTTPIRRPKAEPTGHPIARCPICHRAAVPASRPFCSPRCAEVDLGRWLTGQYVVPGPPADLDDDPPPTSEPA
jgi:uncharacterized protein